MTRSAVNDKITHEQLRNVLIRRPSPIQKKITLTQLKIQATRRRKQPYVSIRGKSISLSTRVRQLMSSTPKHTTAFSQALSYPKLQRKYSLMVQTNLCLSKVSFKQP